MLLSVKERLLLLNLLPPAEGDILLLRVVSKLRRDLSFTEDELAAYKIRQSGTQIIWDTSVPQTKEVEIGARALEYVAKCLKSASESGRLSEELLSVYDSAVGEGE